MLGVPHHDGSALYLPDGEGRLGDTVRVRVRIPAGDPVQRIHVRSTPDGEPRFGQLQRVSDDGSESWWEGPLELRNPTTSYRFLLDGGARPYRWLTQAGVVTHDVPDDTDFRLVAGSPGPAWVGGAVLYQVFPDRFADSGRERDWPEHVVRAAWDDPVATEHPTSMHQFYGGDLWGVVERLDHLAELGVTGVYLNPIFPSPENHRYCASSFDEVDPLLGGDEALAALAGAMHDRGLVLIGDLTANHTGAAHPWFGAAREAPDAPEAAFYHWIEHPDRYEAWLGVPTLPKLDLRSPTLRERLFRGDDSVVARWLRPPFELDGWRVDAANMAGRCRDVDVTHEVAREIRRTVERLRPEAYLVAEHCHDASLDLRGDGWHGTMNYAGFTRPLWQWLVRDDVGIGFLGVPVPVPRLDGAAVAATIDAFAARIPWRSRRHSMNLLGSHDTARWRYVTGDRDRALVGAAVLLTFPGVPSILYGDEIGLAGEDDARAREPMPWADRERWDEVTLTAYRTLIRLRHEHAALRDGGFRWADVGADTLTYLRETADQRILVHVARAPHPPVTLPTASLGASAGRALVAGRCDLEAADGALSLPADGPAWHVWELS